MSTTRTIKIEQIVSAGRYVGGDKTITLRRSEDFIADYGDDAPRMSIELSASVVDLSPNQLDELIENLTIARRIITEVH